MSIVRLTKKNISLILLFGLLNLISCQPSKDDTPSPNPGGSGGDITITSVTPDLVYADDEITISGNGFNPDPTLDTVQIGRKSASGNFLPFENTFGMTNEIKVLSATPTKLVVTPVEPKTIDSRFMNYGGSFVVRVKANKKTAIGSIKRWRNLMVVTIPNYNDSFHHTINVSSGRCSVIFHPGDSIVAQGRGFYPPCSLFIDGIQIQDVVFSDSTHWHARFPKSLFGYSSDDCVDKIVTAKIINGDGKSGESEFTMAMAPPMAIFSVDPGSNSFSKSTTNHINLTVNGYSLYEGCSIKVMGPGGYSSEGPLGASGYQNNVVVPFSIGGWTATAGGSTYNFFIKRPPSLLFPVPQYGFPIASVVIYP